MELIEMLTENLKIFTKICDTAFFGVFPKKCHKISFWKNDRATI
ncbi:conserved hypothetical protein [delta proteobacterium NaphS2]|nr:conserved hypothetical protein [delta proteobacterium NaphS2]